MLKDSNLGGKGFALAKNTEDTFTVELAKDPARTDRFAVAMNMFIAEKGNEAYHIVDNFPWGEIGEGVVVDVGGSYGTVALAIAEAFPALSCIVQDLPGTIDEALEKVSSGSTANPRVRFMAHDFFTEQPIKGADVYYFRWILHNWSDEYAVRILQALIPALKPGARVIVNEFCLPGKNVLSPYKERLLRYALLA